jgi:hypothetical protein
MLASDTKSSAPPERRDRHLSRLGGAGLMTRMIPPDGHVTLIGFGGTAEEAAQDALAQAARIAS